MLPLISLCTGLILALLLFWFPKLRIRLFYTETQSISTATHIYVEAADGKNVEIIELGKSSEAQAFNDTFTYRFIKFEFNSSQKRF